jgi:SAM-dependent methyltransferase
MDRTALLLGDATKASRILEIGPSHAPIAPKRDGWKSFVVDHADQATLREKYAPFAVDFDAIEEVDAIWAGGRLDAVIPPTRHGSFDRIIASHVIEHIPDPVTFLTSAHALLAPGGALALAVPDKRYCFDFLKPHATTGDLLASHDPNGPGRHTPRTLFNQIAHSTFVLGEQGEDIAAWGQHPIGRIRLVSPLKEAFVWSDRARGAEYLDAHAWQFTPCAFELAILELAEGGVIDWHVESITGAHGAEFFVTLRRGRAQWPSTAERDTRRQQLLLGILAELREQIDWMALGGLLTRPALPADAALARHIADMHGALATASARLDIFGALLSPPGGGAPMPGSLADISQRLDLLQRQVTSITAGDGTMASIMGSLELVGTRQNSHQKAIADTAQLALNAGEQALEAARLLHIVTGRLEAQQQVMEEQRRLIAEQGLALAEVHTVTNWLGYILRPFARFAMLFRRNRGF